MPLSHRDLHLKFKNKPVIVRDLHMPIDNHVVRDYEGTCLAVVAGTYYYIAIVEIPHDDTFTVVDVDVRRIELKGA